MNLDYLETIGKFIGTYGLAVFLVLYYAVRLYPEMQKERAEWIHQITRLRQLVDPATRPLTRDQARTVLQLAGDALADRLRLVLEIPGRYPSSWSGAPASPEAIGINIFGIDLTFDPGAEMTKDQRDQEFSKLTGEIERALREETRRARENIEEAFKFVSEMSRRDAYRLALLRFGNTSLETIWTNAYDEATKQWNSDLANTLQPTARYEIDEARRFLGKHPSQSSNRDAIDALFAKIRTISGQEQANYLKTYFERQVEEKLKIIDSSAEVVAT